MSDSYTLQLDFCWGMQDIVVQIMFTSLVIMKFLDPEAYLNTTNLYKM